LESDINSAKTVNIKINKNIKESTGKTEELKKQIAEKKRLATLARDEIEMLNNLINQTEYNTTLLVEKEEEIASVIITKLQIENEELKRNQTVKPESVEDKNKILLLQTEKKIVEDKTKQLQMDELKNKSVKVASDSEFLNNRIMNLTVQVEYFNSARQKTENAIRNCELKAQTFFMEKNQIEGEASNMELHPGFHEKLNELKRVDWCCLVKKCGEIDKTRFLSSQMLQQYQGFTFRPVTKMEPIEPMQNKCKLFENIKTLIKNDHDSKADRKRLFRFGRSLK
jgi:chromosome segregation ATPase